MKNLSPLHACPTPVLAKRLRITTHNSTIRPARTATIRWPWQANLRGIIRRGLFIPIAILLLTVAPAQAQGATAVYGFGVVPQFESRKLLDIWWPILRELERRTGFKLELRGSPSIPAFHQDLLAGRFDFAYMSPYNLLQAAEAQGYQPLIRDGQTPLQGILVVRRDSPIQSITDLQGQAVAFPAPNALAASLLMRAELNRQNGVSVEPRYVKSHTSVYLHVLHGLTTAGGGVLRTLRSQEPMVQDHLRIIHTSPPLAPHPVAAHPRIPAAHQDLLQQAFLSLADSPAGRALLAEIPMPRPVTAYMQDYQILNDWELTPHLGEQSTL